MTNPTRHVYENRYKTWSLRQIYRLVETMRVPQDTEVYRFLDNVADLCCTFASVSLCKVRGAQGER